MTDFDDLLATLKKTAAALRDAEVPFLLGGGLAAWARGGPETEHDLDLMVAAGDAESALRTLQEAGFRGEEPPEDWLYKAWDGDILVDLIFNHFTPRYVATGVDPHDLARLATRIERWDDWCREWSAEAARHEQLAEEARARGRQVTATEGELLPVLAARDVAVADHLDRMFPETVTTRVRGITDEAGWHEGAAAADRAQVRGRRPLP